MAAAPRGGAQKEEEQEGMDEQDMCAGVVRLLAALPRWLCSRGVGADEASFGAVRGQRGASGVATGAGAASRASTTAAAAASAPPRRGASAVRARAGAAPRGRRAARSPGRSTGLPWLAWLGPMPHRRPGPPGRR